MNIAIVGGGINGVCCAWALAERGHRVVLYERDHLMRQTSSASSKLLHGGLRYLEHGELRLVREALRERAWWLAHAPHLAHPLQLLLPVYRQGLRPRWQLKLGMLGYDLLSGFHRLGRHRWYGLAKLRDLAPQLDTQGLIGAYGYWDGQMDDHHLGLWAAEQARKAGAMLLEHQNVLQVTLEGQILQAKGAEQYDIVINVAGPWAEELLQQSQINSPYQLDLVRGSHILLSGEPPPVGFCLETGEDERIFFVLPYQGHILVGTTEVRQAVDQMPWCTPAEVEYLLRAYNRHFQDTRTDSDIIGRYAGIRPLLRSAQDPSSLSREYVIWRDQRLLCVFGGKWTTARALARKVANMLEMDTAG